MALDLECPCEEKHETYEFEVYEHVDNNGLIIGGNVPFDRAVIEERAYQLALHHWNVLAKHLACPGDCDIRIIGGFDQLPTRVGPVQARKGGVIVKNTWLWTATATLDIWARCEEA